MQQTFSCSKCGNPVAQGQRFCGNCGLQLNWSEQPVIERDIPLSGKIRLNANNIRWGREDDTVFLMLLYTLKPRILQLFAAGKSLTEIEAELGQPFGLIRAIMDKTKVKVTMKGKTKIMSPKELAEFLRNNKSTLGDNKECFNAYGQLSETYIISFLEVWTII